MAKEKLLFADTDEFSGELDGFPDDERLPGQAYTEGWRVGVISCVTSTSVVFLINLAILLETIRRYGIGGDSLQTIYSGNCDTVRRLNLVVHLILNGFSTILLSSSNYCMQCLSAPTRSDVDASHEGKTWPRWLDIGVPSARNLWRIEKKRVMIWVLLGFTSVPLHLFYNSTVFTSIASYSYPIVVADDEFLSNPVNSTDVLRIVQSATPSKLDDLPSNNTMESATVSSSAQRLSQKAMLGSLERLDVDSCISAYAQNFVTSRGGLVLVLDTSAATVDTSNATIYDMVPNWSLYSADWCQWDPYSWVCRQDGNSACYPPPHCCHGCRCDELCEARLPNIRANSSGWRPFNQEHPVKYCLSETLPEQCKLQTSRHIAVVVVILNLIKAALMAATLFGIKESPLMTIGDAISSFLLRQDPSTRNQCLVSSSDVRKDTAFNQDPRFYSARPRRWFSAASKWRWAMVISMLVAALSGSISLLVTGTNNLKGVGALTDLRSLWSLGIGNINAVTIIDWTIPSAGAIGLISNVLVANIPQVVLSLIYFAYNGLFTTMFLAAEWDGFSQSRRGLRLSRTTQGAQRSSYFLQLPYRVAIPLMVGSGLLHWLVSQSGFLIDIEGYEWDDSNGEYTQAFKGNNGLQVAHLVTCGFSPMAMLFVILVIAAMIVAVVATSFMRFKSGMPIASSCSIAISAACHPGPDELDKGDLDCKILQWGVIGTATNGVDHCSFSSGEVYTPEDGVRYA